jgi:hypothetical protein
METATTKMNSPEGSMKMRLTMSSALWQLLCQSMGDGQSKMVRALLIK